MESESPEARSCPWVLYRNRVGFPDGSAPIQKAWTGLGYVLSCELMLAE